VARFLNGGLCSECWRSPEGAEHEVTVKLPSADLGVAPVELPLPRRTVPDHLPQVPVVPTQYTCTCPRASTPAAGAKGLPLREIGPQVGCSHQGVALIVRLAPRRHSSPRSRPRPGRQLAHPGNQKLRDAHPGGRVIPFPDWEPARPGD
jgi:hypothetical protein